MSRSLYRRLGTTAGAEIGSLPAVTDTGAPANSARSLLTSHLKSTQASSASTGRDAASKTSATKNRGNLGLIDCMGPHSLALWYVEIRQCALKGLGREPNGLRERRMRMNGQPDIRRVGTHFDGESPFANQSTGV